MIDALFAIGHAVMTPLYWAVSWILVQFHALFDAIGLNPAGGVTWTLMIVGLVVVIRILLIPLFFKQIKASRDLQLLQPEIKKLQERYKNDKERQSQELMKLYRERKTNPLASCLPILAQGPVFFALFGVLNGIATNVPRGVLTNDLVREGQNASIFGAKIFDTFLAPDNGAARVVALVLIVLMSATTFLTQKQLMTKNMPASAMTGPFAQQQKILLYVFPLMFAVTGVNFPIGVLLYWFTTNLWSMGQQLYVIRRQPAPGSLAAENLERKRADRARQRGEQTGVGAAQAAPAGQGGSMTRMLSAGVRRSALGGLIGKLLSRRARTPSAGDAVVATSRSSGATALGAAAPPGEGSAPAAPPAPRGSAGSPTHSPGRTGGGGRGGRGGARQPGAAGASPASPASPGGRSSNQRQQPRRQSRAKRR